MSAFFDGRPAWWVAGLFGDGAKGSYTQVYQLVVGIVGQTESRAPTTTSTGIIMVVAGVRGKPERHRYVYAGVGYDQVAPAIAAWKAAGSPASPPVTDDFVGAMKLLPPEPA